MFPVSLKNYLLSEIEAFYNEEKFEDYDITNPCVTIGWFVTQHLKFALNHIIENNQNISEDEVQFLFEMLDDPESYEDLEYNLEAASIDFQFIGPFLCDIAKDIMDVDNDYYISQN